ncbi:MAG: ribonuclease H-like domain-containing protein [Candidatus Levybacteria bacterium]|nr:ribonuclease H-like domain-containing protein [Candidatus Levybacteria bacterium]
MIRLFLDIETLPCNEESKAMILEILKKRNSNGKKDDEQLFLQTGLDGTYGRICCIGIIKEGHGKIEKDVIKGTESEILRKFWEIARNAHLFIGHNVMDFDLPFIYQRSIINGVKPSVDLNFARYRSNPIFDTMREWTKWSFNATVKLDTLAKVLHLPTSKDEMDGSMVYPKFLEGKINEICKYCMKDVELNRLVYYRMIFDDVPSS